MNHDEIVAELGQLRETTANLKMRLNQPKGKLDLFKEYAGILSLVLSLATGAFTVVDNFFLRPAKSRADTQTRLHETLASLVSVDQEYLKAAQAGDVSALNGTLEAKHNMLLQEAERLIAKGDHIATYDDQMTLAADYEFAHNLDRAATHFTMAIQSSNDPSEKAMAKARLAKLAFQRANGQTIEDGRRLFDEATSLIRDTNTSKSRIALVNISGFRSWSECSFGDTTAGQAAKVKTEELISQLASDPAVSAQALDQTKNAFETGLAGTHCFQLPKPAQTSPATSIGQPSVSNYLDVTNQVMDLLSERKYAEVEAMFSESVRRPFPQPQLQLIWEQLEAKVGPFQKRLDARHNVTVNNVPTYVVQGQFQKANIDLHVAYDATGQISWFNLIPRSLVSNEDLTRRAAQVVHLFFDEKFAELRTYFDTALANQMPEPKIRDVWMQGDTVFGKLQEIKRAERDPDIDVVEVLCEMQSGGKLLVKIGFDLDLLVNSFYLAPAK
jgi:Protein of unknown function (DUF3887)